MSSNYVSATLAPQDRDDIMGAIAPFVPGALIINRAPKGKKLCPT